MGRGTNSAANRRPWARLWWLLPLLALLLVPLDVIERQPTACLWKNVTGNPCPGCGMGRALFNLLHLNFERAWQLNPLVMAVAPLLVLVGGRTLHRAIRR